jgi:hypothetical protein
VVAAQGVIGIVNALSRDQRKRTAQEVFQELCVISSINHFFPGGPVRHFNSAVLLFAFLAVLSAQETSSSVPRLIRFGSSFKPANGLPPQPTEGAMLSIYREEQGGTPLWQETQNVTVEAEGRYNLLLGSTMTDGLPMELFTAGEPRWLGVTFNRPGEVEQPRVRLASVPYALKAADAETLGGVPASAYLRDPAASSSTITAALGASAGISAPTASTNAVSGKSLKPRATSGITNYLGVFTNATDLGSSALYQSGGQIGLNTTTPFDFLHVRFADPNGGFTGYAVQNLSSGASSYSGMLFYDQNGAVGQFQGFNNSTHEYRINNIASGGTINFMIGGSSKFFVANSGSIGVGTVFPGSAVDVAGDINFSGILRFQATPVFQVSGVGQNANTSVGTRAFLGNSGTGNTGVGGEVLMRNTSGNNNTGVGTQALGFNTTGGNNTAVGVAALGASTDGFDNTAVGLQALGETTDGIFNTAIGYQALDFNTTGNLNIAIGSGAGTRVSGSNSNNIHIGSVGASGDSNTIRLGGGTSGVSDAAIQTSFFAAGIRGFTTGQNNAVPVLIDSNGQLGTVSSSRRFKEDIQDMGETSSGLMRLRPVTFRYKKPFDDGSKPIQYGLIAEEVAEVYPDLVARSADGQIETVKYQVLPSMLLNEVQRQQSEIQGQADQIRALEQQNRSLQERLAKLEAALSSNQSMNPR